MSNTSRNMSTGHSTRHKKKKSTSKGDYFYYIVGAIGLLLLALLGAFILRQTKVPVQEQTELSISQEEVLALQARVQAMENVLFGEEGEADEITLLKENIQMLQDEIAALQSEQAALQTQLATQEKGGMQMVIIIFSGFVIMAFIVVAIYFIVKRNCSYRQASAPTEEEDATSLRTSEPIQSKAADVKIEVESWKKPTAQPKNKTIDGEQCNPAWGKKTTMQPIVVKKEPEKLTRNRPEGRVVAAPAAPFDTVNMQAIAIQYDAMMSTRVRFVRGTGYWIDQKNCLWPDKTTTAGVITVEQLLQRGFLHLFDVKIDGIQQTCENLCKNNPYARQYYVFTSIVCAAKLSKTDAGYQIIQRGLVELEQE